MLNLFHQIRNTSYWRRFSRQTEPRNTETRGPPSGRFTASRILIATVLVFFCQFSGYTIVSFYATAILRMDSGADDANSTGSLFRSTELPFDI